MFYRAHATEIDNTLPEEKMTIKEIPFKGRQSAAIITSTAPIRSSEERQEYQKTLQLENDAFFTEIS